ncbi:MAG: protein-glutamate O-methyltransferase CheR [Deltaproteobacteria bacterium]|nr:protein-glutamate O-methyltransferase CheR [Deltaproteobacteria bacterium]
MTALAGEELRAWLRYIHSITGIHLDESKSYLIENRLSGLREAEGCATLGELYYRVRSDRGTTLRRKVIDAITTGETYFFRDQNPFELLRHKLLPELIDRRSRELGPGAVPLRIWSAACSTGQEVYSIAIVLRELLDDGSGYRIRLLGTDISDQAVSRASYGTFSNFEVERGLSGDKRDRHFARHGDGWRVRDELRAMAVFRTMNLMEDFACLGRFDIIFCRNIAIYFKEEDRVALFKRIARVMEPDGALVIGSMEAVATLCPEFEPKRYHRTVFYALRT